MTDAEFMIWLREQNQYIVILEEVGDGRWVSVERLMFHYTIKVGTVGDTSTGYEDRWCIRDLELALRSFAEWKEAGFQGEPKYWRRHPRSGRRRNDVGDPATEWVAH